MWPLGPNCGQPLLSIRDQIPFSSLVRKTLSTLGLLEVLSESLATNLPTRFVCLIPSQDKLPSHFLELATIDHNAPLFGFKKDASCLSQCTMSIVLASSTQSIGERLYGRLVEWSTDHITIPKSTDDLFRERETLHHPPRSLSKQPQNIILNSCSIINFHDAFAPVEKPQNIGSVSARMSELIMKMNRHPRFLSLLGILPNHFRTLLKRKWFPESGRSYLWS